MSAEGFAGKYFIICPTTPSLLTWCYYPSPHESGEELFAQVEIVYAV